MTMNAQIALLVAGEARRSNVAREPSSLDYGRTARTTDASRTGFRTALARMFGRSTPAASHAR
jgi:hypothetical protein